MEEKVLSFISAFCEGNSYEISDYPRLPAGKYVLFGSEESRFSFIVSFDLVSGCVKFHYV